MDPEELVLVGEMPRMLVKIVGECMAPLVGQLAESRKAREDMAGIRSEISRMANTMEEIALPLRVKWSVESARELEVVANVGKAVGKGKTVAAVPEESSSSEGSEEEDEDDEDKDNEEDEDVDMDGSVGGGAGPISISSDPVTGPSSSSAA
jgi:flagellar motor protein MotB